SPLAHSFRHVSLLSLGRFPRDISLQEMPDFIGPSAEIWVHSHLRADLVPHRARSVPARGGTRVRQAARAAPILRSAGDAPPPAQRTAVRASRSVRSREGRQTLSPCARRPPASS